MVKKKAKSTKQNKNTTSSKSKNILSSKKEQKPKTFLGKAWHFIWYDDSALSWIANIILAFIIIKFIIYPLLALAFGTNLPIVAVVSSSMEHDGSFDDWWSSQAICDNLQVCSQGSWYATKNISRDDFSNYKLKNGFNKGDLIVLFGVDENKIKEGDIIVYSSEAKSIPIIHRVINIRNGTELIFETKGDNNPYQITSYGLDETNISYEQVIGKASAKIPFLGYVKIWFSNMINFVLGNSNDYSNVDVSGV